MTRLYDALLSVVPPLRRYASLLTGSREAADVYVQTCLERLVAAQLRDVADLRLHAFRTLHRCIGDAEIALDTSPLGATGPIERGLLTLPIAQRATVLLVTVEGLSIDATASVLRRPAETVRNDLAAGRATLHADAALAVFIIEDEWLVAEQIGHVASGLGLRVCGTAARREEALAGVAANRPALILSDVELGFGRADGLALSDEIRQRFDVPVIYVTAYPERVRAHDRDALVLTKPLSAVALSRAIDAAMAGTLA
jgi:DNA-directed RNA polymerase specialized sigma24 family protein/CheY-like chemotaxis protein